MKLLTLTVAVACPIGIFAPRAMCQNNPEPLQLIRPIPGSGGGRVLLTASSIQRDLSSTATESIIQLKGNVEIKLITCVPAEQGRAGVCEGAMVLHAGAVEYNEKTGEINAHGDVRITPHEPLH